MVEKLVTIFQETVENDIVNFQLFADVGIHAFSESVLWLKESIESFEQNGNEAEFGDIKRDATRLLSTYENKIEQKMGYCTFKGGEEAMFQDLGKDLRRSIDDLFSIIKNKGQVVFSARNVLHSADSLLKFFKTLEYKQRDDIIKKFGRETAGLMSSFFEIVEQSGGTSIIEKCDDSSNATEKELQSVKKEFREFRTKIDEDISNLKNEMLKLIAEMKNKIDKIKDDRMEKTPKLNIPVWQTEKKETLPEKTNLVESRLVKCMQKAEELINDSEVCPTQCLLTADDLQQSIEIAKNSGLDLRTSSIQSTIESAEKLIETLEKKFCVWNELVESRKEMESLYSQLKKNIEKILEKPLRSRYDAVIDIGNLKKNSLKLSEMKEKVESFGETESSSHPLGKDLYTKIELLEDQYVRVIDKLRKENSDDYLFRQSVRKIEKMIHNLEVKSGSEIGFLTKTPAKRFNGAKDALEKLTKSLNSREHIKYDSEKLNNLKKRLLNVEAKLFFLNFNNHNSVVFSNHLL